MRLLILLLMKALPLHAGYAYYISHTPAASQVSSGPHTDFPVLIDVTDNTLKTTGNGGQVTDAQGDDIVPHSDATCTTAITAFELIAYDGTTGRIRMWVKISSLSTSTTVYLCYGNSAITTAQGTASSTWSAYSAVYHFGDGTTVSMADSAGSNTFTNSGGTATTGQIYGGISYAAASTQYSYVNSAVVSSTPLTITVWAKSSVTSGVQPIATIQSAGSNFNMHRLILYQSKVQVQTQITGGTSGLAATTANYSTSNWFHAAGVWSSATSRKVYLNGANSATDSTNLAPTGLNKTQTRTESVDEYMDGSIDELRFASAARSDGWIATEYNSGNPSTFWTIGSPTAISVTTRSRRIFIQ